MAVPKKKTSKSVRNMRRSHHALKRINAVEDATTGEFKLPHHVSPDGFYKGRKIKGQAAPEGSGEASANQ